jgi:hypothetical protein
MKIIFLDIDGVLNSRLYYKEKSQTKRCQEIIDVDGDELLFYAGMMLWQQNNYFRVDRYCGLTPNLIHRCINYLNKGER